MSKELWYRNFTISEERNLRLHIKNTGIPIKYSKISLYEIILSYKYNDSISEFKIENGIIDYSFSVKNASNNIFIKLYENFNTAFNKWINQLRTDFNNTFFERRNAVINISEKFYPVFEEAIMINRLGFEESSGMIFRKAVEILFKDYLSHTIPAFNNEIKQMTVGRLVNHFYTNKLEIRVKFNEYEDKLKKIKPLINFINQTFKVGNDFSHYDRKLEKLTAKNMEGNIYKIIQHIVEDAEINELQSKKSQRDDDMIGYRVSD